MGGPWLGFQDADIVVQVPAVPAVTMNQLGRSGTPDPEWATRSIEQDADRLDSGCLSGTQFLCFSRLPFLTIFGLNVLFLRIVANQVAGGVLYSIKRQGQLALARKQHRYEYLRHLGVLKLCGVVISGFCTTGELCYPRLQIFVMLHVMVTCSAVQKCPI